MKYVGVKLYLSIYSALQFFFKKVDLSCMEATNWKVHCDGGLKSTRLRYYLLLAHNVF